MPRRPKVWFDYEYLASLDAENAPREVFFLSEPAQQALSQLAEIVLWPTRWFNGDPEASAALAASIYEELKVPAHFDDLIPLLDDVETLLQELIDKELCCDTIDSVPGGDGIGGVDESTLPPDVDRDGESLPPEYEGDPTAYDAYLCGQAEAIADSTDDAVDAVHDTILAASNVIVFATLVILAFGNVIGMGIAAILAGGYTLVTISEIVGYYSAFTELRELLGGGDPGGLVAQTKGEMSSIHDDIIEAIYCANDAAEASANLHSLVDATVTSGAYASLLKLTYSIAMRPVFWGFGGAPDSESCSCTAFFSRSWTFDATTEDWTGASSWESEHGGSIRRGGGASDPQMYLTKAQIRALGALSVGAVLQPTLVRFDFRYNHGDGMRCRINDVPVYTKQGSPLNVWTESVEVDLTGEGTITLDDSGDPVISFQNLASSDPLYIDNVYFECEDGS